MLLGRASSSDSSTVQQNALNHTITEIEFRELFPNGYCEFNYLESLKEYWDMDKGGIYYKYN